MKDENQIAHRILRTVTETTGYSGGASPSVLYARLGGAASVAAVSAQARSLNGLKGAIARWGTIRDNQPMPASRKNLDMSQLAKRILDEATGDEPKTDAPTVTPRQENSRKGGIKGGASRAAKLTPEQRSEIAKKAAQGRWSKG